MRRHPLLVPVLLSLSVSFAAVAPAAAGDQKVKALIADLKKGEPQRTAALQALEALGPKAADATPALIDLLANKDEFTRLQSAIVLGKIGTPAVAPLTELLTAKDEDVRLYAAWGLAFVGPKARSATAAVVKALADPAASVRRKAVFALGRINPDPGPAVAALVKALEDKDEDVRQAAAAALPQLGPAAVPVLVKVLDSDKAALRNLAIKTLGDIGPAAESAIPQLKALLLEPAKGAAEPAADALAGIGARAVRVLTAAAGNEDAAVRGLALRSLHKIGAPAVPALVDLLGAKYTDVRRTAAGLLGALQVRDKMVVIGLGYALKDADSQVKFAALQALRGMGTGAKLAEPYVSGLLVDLDPKLRVEAFHVLTGLGADPRPGLKKALAHTNPAIRIPTASLMTALGVEIALAEPVLVAGLKEKNAALRMQAAYSLANRGLKADEVLPIFLEGLKNDVASVRRQAAEAIAPYGPKAARAVPALTAALDDRDDAVRAQALQTLRKVADAKTLLPVALKVLRHKDTNLHDQGAEIFFQIGPESVSDLATLLRNEKAPGLRLVCVQALAMVGPRAKDAVPELIRALADAQPRTRLNAARALGNIGPDAKAAADALKKATQDGDDNVRKLAAAALTQINADPKQKGFEVQGVLTPGDPTDKVRVGHYAVVHTYFMKAGQRYTIDLIAPWDNFLRLEDAQGKQLAQDDDGGGYPNARIVFDAPADGYYRIIVTSFAPKTAGPYTLKVK